MEIVYKHPHGRTFYPLPATDYSIQKVRRRESIYQLASTEFDVESLPTINALVSGDGNRQTKWVLKERWPPSGRNRQTRSS